MPMSYSYRLQGFWRALGAAAFALLVMATSDAQYGRAWSWGGGFYGQQGDGTNGGRSTPGLTLGPPYTRAIAAGKAHSLARGSDGIVWAWGWNFYGQLGDGTTTNRWTPVQPLGLFNVVKIAAGGAHSLVVQFDGMVSTVWAWGANDFGMLGDGTTTRRHAPVQTQGLTNVIAIAAGDTHSLALRGDGTVWAWGDNGNGAIGDGTDTQRLTPVQTQGLSNVVAIAAGDYHSLALRNDGTVWAWGGNYSGQLGDRTNVNRWTPVQPLTGEAIGVPLTGVVAIAAGSSHSLAVRSDGTVWAWGANDYGRLGDGSTMERWSAVQTQGLVDVVAVAGGAEHSLALLSDGTVWAWGRNLLGQLGDGTTINRWTPVQSLGLTNVFAVAGGGDHSLAIRQSFLSGTVNLQDVQSMEGLEVAFEAKSVQNGQVVDAWLSTLDANGTFSEPTPLPLGSYNISVRGPTWLSDSIGPVEVTGTDVSGLTFDLFNGDVNGDNTVNILDFLILRAAFGSSPSSGNWDESADLNRSGTVNVQDFLILRKNFGKSGN